MVEHFAKEFCESKKIVFEDEFVSVEELLRKTDGPKVVDIFDNPKDSTDDENKNNSGKGKIYDETDSVDQESIEDEETSGSREEIIDALDSSSDENKEKKQPRIKKPEVERLPIENKEFQEPLKDLRSRSSNNNCYQFCSSYWMASMVAMCNMVEVIGGQLQDISDKVDSGGYILGLEYEGDMLDEAEDLFDLDEGEGDSCFNDY